MLIGWEEVFLRLLVGTLLSGLIGWEREAHKRPAGLRTHMLVGIGATLIMMVSNMMVTVGPAGTSDGGRIAAQVVSGIGFLGAGTILRDGVSIRGLTTAASLWVVAAIGLAVGAGAFIGAALATVIVLATLIYARSIEQRMAAGKTRLQMRVQDQTGALGEITSILGRHQISIRQVEILPTDNPNQVAVQFYLLTPSQSDALAALETLSALDYVFSLQMD